MANNTSNTFLFNDRAIAKLAPPSTKAQQYSDSKVPSLKLEVQASGHKSFSWRRQRDGRKLYQHIGDANTVKVEDARKRALDLSARLDLGEDPTEERNRLRTEPNLAEFFARTYKPHASSRKRSFYDDENCFNYRIKAALGNMKISQIRRRDVQAFLDDLSAAGLTNGTVNRFQALLSSILRLAQDQDLIESNPCGGIRQRRENSGRTRFLTAEEIARYVAAAKADKNQTAANCLVLLLLTGARKTELLTARWQYFSAERGQLELPVTKNGHRRHITLSDQAQALIESLPSNGQSPWLFPADDPEKHVVNLDKAHLRIKEVAGLGDDVVIHSLRHTHASHLAMNGVPLQTIAMALGQRTLAMAFRYSHLDTGTLRQTSNLVGNIVSGATKGQSTPA